MTQTNTTPVVIFGDPELEIWGLLIADERPRLALATLDAGGVSLDAVTLDRDDGSIWSVTTADHKLRIEKAQAPTRTPGDELRLEPVRVTGSARVGDADREIDIAGVLTDGGLESASDSLRLFASWFPAGHQVVLRATRPRAAKGQDRDVINVIALGEQEPVVFDPRLSTTYDARSAPLQAGIELWLGTDEDADQYPRRVAGVATGSTASDVAGGTKLDAHALTCLSRGELGAGVYLLVH